jgi:hypothetical protein
VSAAASASARAGRVTEAWPEAAAPGRRRVVPTETSADARPGTRARARIPPEPLPRPAWTVAPVRPEPAGAPQLPSSLATTRPSAQTRTSAEVDRPTRAETSAETSWALALPAPRASSPPPSAATPIARFIHKFT